MLRCRENDLAIILVGQFRGYMVTVGEFVGHVPGAVYATGQGMEIPDAWVIHSDTIPLNGYERLVAEDKNLQPIRGRGTDQTTTTEKELRA